MKKLGPFLALAVPVLVIGLGSVALAATNPLAPFQGFILGTVNSIGILAFVAALAMVIFGHTSFKLFLGEVAVIALSVWVLNNVVAFVAGNGSA